jgi:hypothetical protein
MAVRHPQGGAPSFMGTRAYKVKEFPFLLIYRPSTEESLVVAVAATSKEENYWSSRLD